MIYECSFKDKNGNELFVFKTETIPLAVGNEHYDKYKDTILEMVKMHMETDQLEVYIYPMQVENGTLTIKFKGEE